MLDEVDGAKPRKTNYLSVYSNRLARMFFLETACDRDHPVLKSEVTLVEMARAKLREQVLTSRVSSGEGVASAVRSLVKGRLAEIVHDEEDLGALIKKADDITFESIMGPSSDN